METTVTQQLAVLGRTALEKGEGSRFVAEMVAGGSQSYRAQLSYNKAQCKAGAGGPCVPAPYVLR